MLTLRRGAVVAVLLVSPSPLAAQAPTDVDCSAANTRVAQTVCASPDLVELGQIIADGYVAAVSLADSPAAEVRRRFDWLQRRDRCNSERGEMLVSCVQSAYEERAAEVTSRLGALNKVDTDSLAAIDQATQLTQAADALAAAQAADALAAEQRALDSATQLPPAPSSDDTLSEDLPETAQVAPSGGGPCGRVLLLLF